MNVSEYLSDFISGLKEIFKEENGWAYDINMNERYIKLVYSDAYQFEEIFIDINRYDVPVVLTITRADFDDEIFTPESCHECGEFCEFYDSESGECTLSDETIDKEIEEWNTTIFESKDIVIRKVVVEVKCFINIPHTHYYRGYEIKYFKDITVDTIKAIDELFDVLISLVEK
jgi:hypothetical protein